MDPGLLQNALDAISSQLGELTNAIQESHAEQVAFHHYIWDKLDRMSRKRHRPPSPQQPEGNLGNDAITKKDSDDTPKDIKVIDVEYQPTVAFVSGQDMKGVEEQSGGNKEEPNSPKEKNLSDQPSQYLTEELKVGAMETGSESNCTKEDEVEAARSAAINQEIQRVLTEVLLKASDELFDEIATKVLDEDEFQNINPKTYKNISDANSTEPSFLPPGENDADIKLKVWRIYHRRRRKLATISKGPYV